MKCSFHVSHTRLLSVGTATFVAMAAGLSAQPPGSVGARDARTVDLVENAQLHLIHEAGSTLNEKGQATGTFNAPVTCQLTLSANHVTAAFVVYPRGGSISGIAHAHFIVKGSTAYYGGTFVITHGSGSYKHASGKNLGISGTINRQNFSMTVKAHGQMNL
jgi:hypothetical protein